jgi:hypothetical protein
VSRIAQACHGAAVQRPPESTRCQTRTTVHALAESAFDYWRWRSLRGNRIASHRIACRPSDECDWGPAAAVVALRREQIQAHPSASQPLLSSHRCAWLRSAPTGQRESWKNIQSSTGPQALVRVIPHWLAKCVCLGVHHLPLLTTPSTATHGARTSTCKLSRLHKFACCMLVCLRCASLTGRVAPFAQWLASA